MWYNSPPMDSTIATSHSIKQLYNRYAYLHDRTKNEKLEHFGFGAKDVSELNWLSFDDLENNLDTLDHWQYSSIRALLNEANSFDRDEKGKIIPNPTTYVGNTIMAQLAKFEYARQMTWCGTTGNLSFMSSTPCSKWKYCERCADAKRKYYFVKYAHVYSCTPDPCYFVTISPDLDKKVIFTEENIPKVLETWDKLNAYVDSMYAVGMIKGAVVVEEASFDSYYPNPVVNPHIHFVCVANGDGLRSHKFDGMKIDVKLIDNEFHWVKGLNYLHKSIQFFHTYNHEWKKDRAEVINRNFRDMLNNHKQCILNRNQTRAIGILHARNKNTMVKSTKVMNEEKKAGQPTKKKLILNYMFEDFKNGAQSRLKRAREKTANVIDVESTPVPAKKKETPFYKNPWVIGGGLLAAGAGAYGAGKLYNGGDNVVNDTLGKGVDDYLVNPIKSLFTPKKPEPLALPEKSVASTPAPVNKPQVDIPALEAAASKPKDLKPVSNDYYQLAAENMGKQKYQGDFPNLQGVGPLKPELQLKGLADNPQNAAMTESYKSQLTAQQNIKNLTFGANQFINGDERTQNQSDAFRGKTTSEVADLLKSFQADDTRIKDSLNPDVKTVNDYVSRGRANSIVKAMPGSAQGPSGVEKFLDKSQVPSTVYDVGYEFGRGPASRLAALPSVQKALGPVLPAAGKVMTGLNPVSAGLGSSLSGYSLGEDAALDPTRLDHKAMAGVGISPENMKYMSAAAHGTGAAAGNSLVIPQVRKMLMKSLAKGALTGEATAGLGPVLAGTAAVTSSLAAPAADIAMETSTKNFNEGNLGANTSSTLFNQLLDAKKRMASTNDASELKGLLATNDFQNIGTSPQAIDKLIKDLGPGPANALLAAKKEGIMGLLSKKVLDLTRERTYIPADKPYNPSHSIYFK